MVVVSFPMRPTAPIKRYVDAYIRGLNKDERIAKAYLTTRVPKPLQTQVYEEAMATLRGERDGS